MRMLDKLLSVLNATELYGAPEASHDVSALTCDSREAGPGSLLFCLVGKRQDGHRFAHSAYDAGCRLFTVERRIPLPDDALEIVVPDTRVALADAAATFYGHPEQSVRIVGLTGTKGKTSTAILIRHLLCGAGIPTGYIGTNGVDFADRHFPTANSTPESLELYRYLAMMRDAGMTACALEVSSQALWMERTRGLVFDCAVFTNLSRDHIGGVEHPDFEHYRASKRRLFTDYSVASVAVNRDDPATAFMLEGLGDETTQMTFGLIGAADSESPLWAATNIQPARREGAVGVSFTCLRAGKRLPGPWFLPMPGSFNVQNALAALAAVCERFGVPPETARQQLATASVPGRFETVHHPGLPEVTFVIDYAHNGVSLAAILDALRAYHPTRLIALFGSVGDRTKERRRDLALAAAGRADLCILTSDNPGGEAPDAIIREIDAAFPADACPRLCEPDRAEAIRLAVSICKPGDIILLAGKGHEDYQLIGREHVPFCERDILLQAAEDRATLLTATSN